VNVGIISLRNTKELLDVNNAREKANKIEAIDYYRQGYSFKQIEMKMHKAMTIPEIELTIYEYVKERNR